MADKKIALGPTGERVRQNVARLRGSLGLQYKELSDRLAGLGRSIPPLGLRRIEAGERRVDADDLMAFGGALDVTPLNLLLPADGSRDLTSTMTGVPDRDVAHNVQWLWGLAREPLTVANWPGGEHVGQGSAFRREVKEFEVRVNPTPEARLVIAVDFPPDGTDDEEARKRLNNLTDKARIAQGVGLSEEDSDPSESVSANLTFHITPNDGGEPTVTKEVTIG